MTSQVSKCISFALRVFYCINNFNIYEQVGEYLTKYK